MLKRTGFDIESHAPVEEPKGLDLHSALNFLWRRWLFILCMAGLGLLFGSVQLAREIPRYTATVQMLLDPRKEKASGNEAFLTDVALDSAYLDSQLSIIRSSVLMRRVVERENLTQDTEFGASEARNWSLIGTVRSLAGSEDKEERNISAASLIQSTEALKGSVSASRMGQGYLLGISVTSIDPEKAARLANAVAEAYSVNKLESRFDAAKRASAWLGDRLQELKAQVRQSEEAVVKFRADNKLLQTGPNLSLNQQQLSDVNGRLVAARADTAEKKARYDVINSRNGRDLVQNLPDIMNQGTLATLRQQQLALSQKAAELIARYNAGHPVLVNLQAQKRDIEQAMAVEVRRAAEAIKNEYEMARAREANLERSVQQATGQTGADDETWIRLRELERTAAVNKSLFEDFLQRAKMTDEQATFDPRDIQVISPALPPSSPSYPIRSRVLGTALMIGLALGIAGAAALEMLNSGFTTPQQVEERLGLPLLASIGQLSESDLKVDGVAVPFHLYPLRRPLSRLNESMRSIRTGLQISDVDRPPTVIQMTSTVPGEGKTTLALAFAASLAASNLKVLLIDADLRHPSASKIIGALDRKGLVDYLTGSITLDEAYFHWTEANLKVLPAGTKTQSPPDLLNSHRMQVLLHQLKSEYDYIIIDTPPVAPVVDAQIVSRVVDKTLFVVRWASTAREVVQRSVGQLDGHDKIAGVIFNMVDERQAQKYGRHAQSYYSADPSYARYYVN
ncbi:MAG: polysaccharide biosynthesis tyrosine autokinase [Beijerinckiaceae bacterium]|nr:polysaccharide biosynthesis tyrosine autokinase [Beijerinckiaceae bacterium]